MVESHVVQADATAAVTGVGSAAIASTEEMVVVEVEPTTTGELWFEATDPTSQLDVIPSNPVWVLPSPMETLPEEALGYGPPANVHGFWGELHSHSNFSDDAYPDSRAASAMYPYMRDDVGLDFGAITDHDHHIDEAEWNAIKDANNDHNCDYDDFTSPSGNCTNDVYFVTILGYEWTDPGDGHKNVYLVRDGDYCESGEGCDDPYDDYDVIPFFDHTDAGYGTSCELWQAYVDDYVGVMTGFDFFTVPHHPAATGHLPNVDWSSCPENCSAENGDDDDFERLQYRASVFVVWRDGVQIYRRPDLQANGSERVGKRFFLGVGQFFSRSENKG